jgi:hypothetical protein
VSGDSLYNYYRDYDSSLGRYVQSDPIGLEGGINTYAYAADSPLNFQDQLGLQVPPLGGAGGIGGMGGLGGLGGMASSSSSSSSSTLAKLFNQAANKVVKMCRELVPCDPPEGTMCYEHHFGHPHADVGKNQSHFHFYLMERIDTGQCVWKEKFGSRGHVDFPPRNMSPCSSYPSWMRQNG